MIKYISNAVFLECAASSEYAEGLATRSGETDSFNTLNLLYRLRGFDDSHP